MKGSRTLPNLKDATLEAINSCSEIVTRTIDFGVPVEVLFQANGVCAELMVLVMGIHSFKARYEAGFYEDDEDEVDGNGHSNYMQDCNQYGEDVCALGHVTGAAVASGDLAFMKHLEHAIKFAGDPGSRRRYAVACAVISIRSSGGEVSTSEVKTRVEMFLGEEVERRSIDDDLEALKIDYEPEPVGRPKKRGLSAQ